MRAIREEETKEKENRKQERDKRAVGKFLYLFGMHES